MRILAVDPGSAQSAWLILGSDGMPDLFGIDANDTVLAMLKDWGENQAADVLAIEYMRPRGMPTSKEEMDTQFFAGRCVQAWGGRWSKVFRGDVKVHLCGSARAKDTNIRCALIDKFGGDSVAIGGTKCGACKGKGDVACGTCRGTGFDRCPECLGKSRKWKTKLCETCGNDGGRSCRQRVVCKPCGASGWLHPPGPLAGITADCWSALGVAVVHRETNGAES